MKENEVVQKKMKWDELEQKETKWNKRKWSGTNGGNEMGWKKTMGRKEMKWDEWKQSKTKENEMERIEKKWSGTNETK